MLDKLLTVPELAAFLDVPRQTVYKWNYTGTGPRSIRVGRFARYRLADVERWLESRADGPRDAA